MLLRSSIVAFFTLSLLTAGSAFAGANVSLPAFTAIDLHGGGHAVLRHGAVQRVTLLKGDTKNSKLEVRGGSLEIDGCQLLWGCPRGYNLEVEIVTPGLTAMSVHGGGELNAKGEFPVQNSMSLSVHGGGDVDIRAIPVKNVQASVHGGGSLRTNVTEALTANVHGGGDVIYSGSPTVTSSVHGGGSVSRE